MEANMRSFTYSHLGDEALHETLAQSISVESGATATVVALIAEIESRRLFAKAGYPSMHSYCVERFGLSEDSALKRIRAARIAREFPVLFAALDDGRLHLSAIYQLSPHLTRANVDELMAAASHKPKSEIARLIADR